MSDSAPAHETIVPVKIPQPEGNAPPSLAEPASGPVATMSGALPQDTAAPTSTHASAPVSASESAPAAVAPAPQSSSRLSAAPASTPLHPDQKPTDVSSTAINGQLQASEPDPQKPTLEHPPAAEIQGPPEEKVPEAPTAEADTEMKDAEPAEPASPADAPAGSAANGTPAPKGKRKSSASVPEHKSKTLKKKQSKAKITNLDAKAGDYYLARLRSYPPWPSIVCDEEMLPEVLLKTRPVTAIQSDGTYKEPYADGGKKVSERTYPVMFLHTNEFGWIPNTELTPLDPESCKDVSEKGKSKQLVEAYKVAAEGHNLAHFKEMLLAHEAAMREDEEKKAEREAAKAEKKKNKRKSDVKGDEDVEMEDAEDAVKKSSKKRKKEADSEDEEGEKTPKTTKLKLTTGKTPTTDKKSKEKAAKPKTDKKKKAPESEEEVEPEKEPAPPVDPVQARKDREKEVLFLRHKLQKGFLSRDQEPAEDEMPQMANFIKKLEAYGGKLDVQIIRNTKINKVLKGIIKLNTIPKDEEYHFKERSIKLLGEWNQLLGADPGDADKLTKEDKGSPTTTNGVHKDAEEKIDPLVDEPKENSMPPAKAGQQPSGEILADAGDKPAAIDEIQQDKKPAEESKTEPASAPSAPIPVAEPAVEDKAPASTAGAAEATEGHKAAE